MPKITKLCLNLSKLCLKTVALVYLAANFRWPIEITNCNNNSPRTQRVAVSDCMCERAVCCRI